ncbi:MAG: hypothetical protein ACRD8U_14165, partial [Pyrinomonadaceae bacterium]
MTIEVTSVPERQSISVRRTARFFRRILLIVRITSRRTVVQLIGASLLIALVIGSDAFLRSYQYYSKIIDARLASGYLTSRPGLYAAPRTIRVGQGFSRENLVEILRNAGYVETGASDVWNGRFNSQDAAIEIRPKQTKLSMPQ